MSSEQSYSEDSIESQNSHNYKKLVIVRMPIITRNPIHAPAAIDVQQFIQYNKPLEFNLDDDIILKPVTSKPTNEYIIEDNENQTTIHGKVQTFIDFLTTSPFVLPNNAPMSFQKLTPNLQNVRYLHFQTSYNKSDAVSQRPDVRDAILQILQVKPFLTWRLLEILFINMHNFDISINGFVIPHVTTFILKQELNLITKQQRISGISYHYRQDIEIPEEFMPKRKNIKHRELWISDLYKVYLDKKDNLNEFPQDVQLLLAFYISKVNQQNFCTMLSFDAYQDYDLIPESIKILIQIMNGDNTQAIVTPFKSLSEIIQSEQDIELYQKYEIQYEKLILQIKLKSK